MNSEKKNNTPSYTLAFSEEELQMIEDMGATGFFPEEVAEVLQVPVEQFVDIIKKKSGPAYQRYRKGGLLGQMKLRQRIATDAGHGSSPAQTLLKKIYDDQEYKLQQL